MKHGNGLGIPGQQQQQQPHNHGDFFFFFLTLLVSITTSFTPAYKMNTVIQLTTK